ncbi:MAG: histidinol-phosphate transaminase [bacterium]
MDDKIWRYAMKGVRDLQPYIPGKPIETLERELGIRDSLKLASNENPLGASPQALEALQTALTPTMLALYPDGNGFMLKQAIADKLKVTPEQITLGNGSNDVLDLIARTFLGDRRDAVFSQYAFAVYPLVTKAVGAKAHISRAHPASHPTAPYGHDLHAMLQQIRGYTHVVFIANPNNPTGTWLDAETLDYFISRVPKHTVIVIDEAYFEYVAHADYPNTLQWLERYPNLVVTRTFSKIYGLASLRVGYAVSSPEIADLLNRVRQPFNVNSFALLAASAALHDDTFVSQSCRSNQAGLKQWEQACQTYQWFYIPSVANFITVKVGENADAIYQQLLQQGIIVRPLANYQMNEFLRISIGTQEQNQRCIDALSQLVQKPC